MGYGMSGASCKRERKKNLVAENGFAVYRCKYIMNGR
jgi:hypothetical protein